MTNDESTIKTISGIKVNFLNPDPRTINIGDIAHSLARINRFTGHTPAPISVATHSINVAYAVFADSDYAVDGPRRTFAPLLMLQALLHDAAEAYIGDIHAPLKRRLVAANIDGIESRLLACIHLALGIPQPDDYVAEIIGIADRSVRDRERANIISDDPSDVTRRFLEIYHLLFAAHRPNSGLQEP